jgi:sortase B
MNRKWIIAFLFLFIISTSYMMYDFVGSYLHYRSNEKMEKLLQEQNTENKPDEDGTGQILPKFKAIYEKNDEFAGWIKIPDTMIDYPVMKPKTDNSYYLDHSPEGKKSKYGSIYLDVATDLSSRKGNYILYGHYFRDGSMFGTLEQYKEKNYWEEHPLIQFDTIYGEGTYEIIAVFLSQVYQKNENAFKYYQYVDITSKEEFAYYVDHVKELSLYDTGKTAQYGDSLITLSTCDYWTENGRLAVVAKKIKE